jgi:hypothetical protein
MQSLPDFMRMPYAPYCGISSSTYHYLYNLRIQSFRNQGDYILFNLQIDSRLIMTDCVIIAGFEYVPRIPTTL